MKTTNPMQNIPCVALKDETLKIGKNYLLTGTYLSEKTQKLLSKLDFNKRISCYFDGTTGLILCNDSGDSIHKDLVYDEPFLLLDKKSDPTGVSCKILQLDLNSSILCGWVRFYNERRFFARDYYHVSLCCE